jgi:GntR family transcriptional regulator/MocR family aminotransferase
MLLPIDPTLTKPLYLQIADAVTAMAVSGQLIAQTRLPSTRQLAEDLHVHRSTIVNAYDELRARGVLVGVHGSGSYIAAGLVVRQTGTQERTAVPRDATLEQRVDELYRLNDVDGVISLALGLPDDALMPIDRFEAFRARVIRREGARLYGEGDPAGDAALRDAIAQDAARAGIQATADDVIVTSGAREALSLSLHALARPGDAVLLETPGWFGTMIALRRLGLQAHGVPVGGITTDAEQMALDTAVAACGQTPRCIIVSPDYQNPTGAQWAAESRHRFLNWASERELAVIDDGTYRETRLDGPSLAPLRAFDPSVLHAGSFSKTLIPGIRFGYLILSREQSRLREHLIALKLTSSGTGDMTSQRALAEFIVSGAYADHLEHTARFYRVRRDAMLDAMARYFPPDVVWTTPSGGFYVWVTLPETRPVMQVFERVLQRGYVIQPAQTFYPEQDWACLPNAFRLCFSRFDERVLTRAVMEIAAAL